MKFARICFSVYALAVCIAAFCISGYAQSLSISASVDRQTISMDDQLTLRVDVSGQASNIPQPQLPPLDGFHAYSSGRSQSISIVNGQVSSQVSFTYILAPKSAGTFTIGPVSITAGGQTISTQPISVTVTASAPGAPGQRAPAQRGSAPVQRAPSGIQDRDLFITTDVDKKRVFVNERIVLTFRFFRRVNLLSQPSYQAPDTTGFWSEDLPPQKNYRTTVDGLEYLVIEINTALFPTAPGNFTIGPAALQVSVRDISRSDPFSDDFFGQFFSRGRTRTLQTSPIAIEVKALPEEGKPASFTGTVGRYTISAELDKTEAKEHEPLTLNITIKGEGNIRTIADPVLPALKDFRVYDTVSSLNISKSENAVTGSKMYKTVIVPQRAGAFRIPSIHYSIFDPEKGRYVTLSTKEVNLNVASQPRDQRVFTPMVATPQGIALGTQDIRYIKTQFEVKDYGKLLYRQPAVLYIFILPVLALGWVFFAERRKAKFDGNVGLMRRHRSAKMARARLKKAGLMLKERKTVGFYAEIQQALTHYLADRLNVSAHGMKMEDWMRILVEKGASQKLVSDFRKIFMECDMARYAPSAIDEGALPKCLSETGTLLYNLENMMRKIL